jgi:hypothetical protein
MDLLTPEYKSQLVQKHQTSPWGGAGWSWIPEIAKLIVRHKLKSPTVLEYGSGRRTFAKTMAWAMPHVRIHEYDPGVPEIDVLPLSGSVFDLVLNTDVMEHVEEQFVEQTFDRLYGYCGYAAVFNIACTPSKSTLPNGKNAHVTVRPPAWWRERVERRWSDIEILTNHKNFTFIATK